MRGIQMTINDFMKMKNSSTKITVVTCYDYTSAKIINNTKIDVILVGDSVANVMYGYDSTTSATIDMLCAHTKAVNKAIVDDKSKKFLISDLPFMCNRGSLDSIINSVQKLIQSGANAIKIEGCDKQNCEIIEYLTTSGIPVMGHIGLTPQYINTLGGYKVQGKSNSDAENIINQAIKLEKSGCFSIVLECIPNSLAKEISQKISIPTIGIGAGPDTDGQVLVLQDLLGMNKDFKPKFVKQYINAYGLIKNALDSYCLEVKQYKFPNKDTSFNEKITKVPQSNMSEIEKIY